MSILKKVFILLAIFFAGLLLSSIFGIVSYFQYQKVDNIIRDTNSTMAKIVKIEVVTKYSPSGSDGSDYQYFYYVYVRYDVDGVVYSDVLLKNIDTTSDLGYRDAIGSQVSILYWKNNPNEAILNIKLYNIAIGFLIGAICSIVGTISSTILVLISKIETKEKVENKDTLDEFVKSLNELNNSTELDTDTSETILNKDLTSDKYVAKTDTVVSKVKYSKRFKAFAYIFVCLLIVMFVSPFVAGSWKIYYFEGVYGYPKLAYLILFAGLPTSLPVFKLIEKIIMRFEKVE